MKFQLFALLLFSVSMVSATDCWQLTSENGEAECFYISFDGCENTYYDEFYNCERDRLDYEYETDNIIKKIMDTISPNSESERLNKLYKWSDINILITILFLFFLYKILEWR